MCEKEIIMEYQIPPNGADPREILRMCRPYMERVCAKAPEEGWLDYTFHWLLAEFFPENFSVERIPGAQEAVDYFTEVLTCLFLRE